MTDEAERRPWAVRGHSVILYSESRQERREVGKVCAIAGRWAFHSDARPEWERHDAGAFGLNSAVVAHLRECGVRDVYLSVRGQGTYCVALRRLVDDGLEQRHPGWGLTINLPIRRWQRVARPKTEWVTAQERVNCWRPEDDAQESENTVPAQIALAL